MKKWYHSRILWLNILALVLTVVELSTGYVLVAAVQDSIVAIITIILRTRTDQGLER